MKPHGFKLLLCIGGALTTFAFAAGQVSHFVRLQEKMRVTKREIMELKSCPVVGATGVRGIEADLNRLAKESRISKLLSVATTLGEQGPETDVEWESDARSTFAFLAAMRTSGVGAGLPRLTLTAMEGEPGTIRGRASLRSGSPTERTTTTVAPRRDAFFPLWKNDIQFARMASENIRREEQLRRRDQEKQEAERRRREEEQQKESRRRAFETRYTLTGIVNDGRGPIAFLTGANQRSFMVRAGERIDDASVGTINASSGEVTLDGADAVSVTLRIGAQGSRP